jgi:hypothetical protein
MHPRRCLGERNDVSGAELQGSSLKNPKTSSPLAYLRKRGGRGRRGEGGGREKRVI